MVVSANAEARYNSLRYLLVGGFEFALGGMIPLGFRKSQRITQNPAVWCKRCSPVLKLYKRSSDIAEIV